MNLQSCFLPLFSASDIYHIYMYNFIFPCPQRTEMLQVGCFKPDCSGSHNPKNIGFSLVSPLLWVLLSLPHQSAQSQHHHP